MYAELPAVPGTAESRIAALKESRQLLKGEAKTTGPAIFGGGATEPGKVADSAELINLATYIETGHAYTDLHPTGKRRPIIKNITVHAHPVTVAMDEEEVPDFIKDLFRAETDLDQPDTADDEESPSND